MKIRALCLPLAAIALLGPAGALCAGTINVTSLNDSGTGTLRAAIASANAGDTIQVFLVGTINLNSGLTINKNLTILGAAGAPGITTIARASGAPNFRIFTISGAMADIRDVTITNGRCGSSEFGGGGIYVTSGASLFLFGVTVSGNDANGNSGGGIFNNNGSGVSLLNCTVKNNKALVGAGVHNNGGSVSLSNCTIANNDASTASNNSGGGGGIFNFNGTISFYSCTITGNSATTNSSSAGGGGIYNFSGTVFEIGNTIVAANTSNQLGPDVLGAFNSGGYNLIRITDGSTGFGNTGDQLGTSAAPRNADLGPLQDNGSDVETRVPNDGSPVIDKGKSIGSPFDARHRTRPYDNPNIANAPGGDGSDIGAVEIQPPTIVSNNNDSGPGSLREALTSPKIQPGDVVTFAPNVRGTIILTSELTPQYTVTIQGPGQNELDITRNVAAGSPEFRIFSGGNQFSHITISGLSISGGKTAQAGGGILNNGTLIIRDCTIHSNIAVGGAGIFNTGTLTVTRCTFAQNADSSQYGGAIYSGSFSGGTAVTTISGSTFFNNSALRGGGLYNDGTLSLTNCTFSGNTTTGSGGAIDNNSGNLTLLNCTISNNDVNTADTTVGGGGIYNSGTGTVHVGNTIVAGNTSNQGGRDVFGPFVSDGYNLIRVKQDSTGFTDGVNHDLVGTAAAPRNAFLGSLQNNGGTTLTLALGSSSPAIDAGNDATAPDHDQRGYARAGTSDIGAYERNGTQANTLANISTRAFVQPGDNVLIGGFIVTGTVQKSVLLRAIGPSLGISGKLANPILELHDGSGSLIIQNDNWMDASNRQAIIDSGIAPSNDLESAILISLNPGNYTVVLRGANDGSGIAVVEAYDLDRTVDAKLANISSRCLVLSGDNVMIGGFIVLGPDSQKVIIRAIGPSLPFAGTLANPTLELHDNNGVVVDANDNWVDYPNKQAILDSTIPPSNDFESAIVGTLAPGNYTAILRGAGDTTGIAVVEVYALQ